jgi:cell pole-organizing protein PopZ
MSESERARATAATAGQPPPGGDPSMEDILASIRRILAEEEGVPAATPTTAGVDDGVLQLDASMMLADPIAPTGPIAPADPVAPTEAMPMEPLPAELPQMAPPFPMAPPPDIDAYMPPAPTPSLMEESTASLMAPEAVAAAATSVGSLLRTLTAERGTQVYSGGPTIEDMVRAELRPLLKQWLDANLPGLVDRLVRMEIERVVGRAVL